ncbi:hypothetical protein [Variovorax sp. KK3]|uniref:hypothetical protein n=1 Tax=Variovorax sp. KK3 TaxID=1855728 RepID=UPI003AAD9696
MTDVVAKQKKGEELSTEQSVRRGEYAKARSIAYKRLEKKVPARTPSPLQKVAESPDGDEVVNSTSENHLPQKDVAVDVIEANQEKSDVLTCLDAEKFAGIDGVPDGDEVIDSTSENHLPRKDIPVDVTEANQEKFDVLTCLYAEKFAGIDGVLLNRLQMFVRAATAEQSEHGDFEGRMHVECRRAITQMIAHSHHFDGLVTPAHWTELAKALDVEFEKMLNMSIDQQAEEKPVHLSFEQMHNYISPMRNIATTFADKVVDVLQTEWPALIAADKKPSTDN